MAERSATRVDFVKTVDGVRVTRFLEQHDLGLSAIPVDSQVKDETFDLEQELEQLRASGWVVRQWPGGARAWLGEHPRPVRSRGRIQKLREELWRWPRPELQGTAHALDLAYDL